MPISLIRQAAIIVFYGLITVILTLPASLHLRTNVIGSGGDPWQAMWRFEDRFTAARTAVTYGELGSFIREEFLGGGEPRLVNLSVWPWMPLHALFGQPAAYNLVWLLSFMVAGYAMYGLVYWVLEFSPEPIGLFQRHAAALVAGVMYMLLPYHVAHAQGHFGAMQIQWPPLVMLAALYFIRRPSLWRTLLLCALIIIQAWTEHHYVVWLAISLVVAAAIYWRPLRRNIINAKPWWLLLVVLVGAALLLSYWPTIRQAVVANATLSLGESQTIRFSADLFAFILPAAFHPWWGSFLYAMYSHSFTGNAVEATQFLGFIPLLLVIFFYQRIPITHKKFWAILGVVFAVLCLGPRLHLFGYVTPIPLPYAAIQSLPVFSAIRAIARAGVVVGLATSVLLGLTLATNVRRGVSFIVVGLLIIAEFLFFPTATQPAQVSRAYDVVADLPGQSIIEIPAATNYDLASRALYASGRHNKIMIGNIALERGATVEDLGRSLPAVRQLLYVRTTDLRENRPEFFGQNLGETLIDVAAWQDIAAIVIHPDSLSAFQVGVLRSFLERELGITGEPYDDMLVYPLTNIDRPSDGFYLMRGDGWGNVGLDRRRDSIFAEIPRRAYITLVNTTAIPLSRQLTFTLPPESHTGITAEYNGAPQELTITNRSAQLTIVVPPGESRLDFINGLPDKAIIQNPLVIP